MYHAPVMAAINGAGLVSKSYPVQDTLFFKLQGTPAAIKETAAAVQKITKKHGSSQFQYASTDQEANELWENRKYALMSTITSGGEGARVWTTDVWYASYIANICGGGRLMHDFAVYRCRACHSWCTRRRRIWQMRSCALRSLAMSATATSTL